MKKRPEQLHFREKESDAVISILCDEDRILLEAIDSKLDKLIKKVESPLIKG